jgi:beta-lactamase class A
MCLTLEAMTLHRILICFIAIICFSDYTVAQVNDRKLAKEVESLVNDFHGVAGVYIKNLKTGRIVSIHADTLFPTASMVKIPILAGIMDKIDRNELDYHQQLLFRDSLIYPGEDILGSFKDSQQVQLSKVIMLMLTTSDNTASLWLQQLAGSGTRINELLQQNGFTQTRVNSRTPGREWQRNMYGWGQTTPREMVLLMEKIYMGGLISPSISAWMLRLLGRNYWDEEGLSQVPPYIFTASKNGAVNRSRSETILVVAPHGPYIFSVITKNQEDESWEPGNEGFVLARKLSKLLWNYFEPRSTWKPILDVNGKKTPVNVN